MNTDYLELLFQHKFAIQKSIENMSITDTFPAETSAYDVHHAKLEMYKQQRDDIQKLINAYIMYHKESEC